MPRGRVDVWKLSFSKDYSEVGHFVSLVNDAAITDIVVAHLSLEPTVHAVLDSRFWPARGLSNDFLTGTFLRCRDDRATGPIAMSVSGAMIEQRDNEDRLGFVGDL